MKKCYEVHVRFSKKNGFSVFFEAEFPDIPNSDDISSEAVNQSLIESEDLEYVDYAVEISRKDYEHAITGIRV